MKLFGKADSTDSEMPFLDHIEVLRWHIVRSLIAVVICSAVAFVNKSFIFDTLIFGPTTENFITYRTLCWISDRISLGKALCIDLFNFSFINIELAAQF